MGLQNINEEIKIFVSKNCCKPVQFTKSTLTMRLLFPYKQTHQNVRLYLDVPFPDQEQTQRIIMLVSQDRLYHITSTVSNNL